MNVGYRFTVEHPSIQSGVRIGNSVRAMEADLHIHSSVTVGIENDHVMKCNPPKAEANKNINMDCRS